MDDIKGPLILDLIEWVATQPRPYGDVMAAWRTNCPRLTIWEDSIEQGFVVRDHSGGQGSVVRATPQGLALLRNAGRLPRHIAAA